MFINVSPKFERGRILKTAMLESLRDFPRDLANITYQGYSNGIITGVDISVKEDVLIVHPGIIKHDGTLYMLKEQVQVPYEATGRLSVLKVAIKPVATSADYEQAMGEVILNESICSDQEIELARFKLKAGAMLRSAYLNFADMATEYNTLNFIYTMYAGQEKPTLSPKICRAFARELLDSGVENPLDQNFAFLCLNQERMEHEVIQRYLALRFGIQVREMDHAKLHQLLMRVLTEGGGRSIHPSGSRPGLNRMVVD